MTSYIVKRLLGVSASGVLTPHQLYRSLLMPEPGTVHPGVAG